MDMVAAVTSGLNDGPARALRIFINDGTGNLSDKTSEVLGGTIPSYQLVRDIHVADFNGDDRDDIFLSNHGKEFKNVDWTAWPCERNALFLSQTNGTLSDVSATNLIDMADFSHGSSVGDIDADGDLDIWVNNLGCSASIPSYLLENDGQGKFTPIDDVEHFFTGTNIILPEASYNTFWSQFFDLNNDGYADLYYSESGHEQRVLLNNGLGKFSFLSEDLMANAMEGLTTQDSAAVDINQDGLDDLILFQTPADFSNGFQFQILQNNTEGAFANVTDTALPTQSLPNSIGTPEFWTIDLEGDGDVDILAAQFSPTFQPEDDIVYFYTNQGNGIFTLKPKTELPEIRPGFTPIDLNGDSKMDFVFTGILQGDQVNLIVVYAK